MLREVKSKAKTLSYQKQSSFSNTCFGFDNILKAKKNRLYLIKGTWQKVPCVRQTYFPTLNVNKYTRLVSGPTIGKWNDSLQLPQENRQTYDHDFLPGVFCCLFIVNFLPFKYYSYY